ncbi:uncharacterized protein MONBRDRAFT_30048 [Monosiga brevicollis MX1]|uniref:DNA-directed RNA polymerases I, II, and III subunit RPABC3 n=1 Tax=Monosiga brevicollis TaxID=81824 RepID=A9VCV6_MONBE|nr:uncharacterized protein MONBRDRAFT_30048 [Monosiga brevicollis MX1]EDQ84634.1 predicted protein [Monosiga brevicollis MX1]|eukprot:XP_001750538.1 hypothetical protein [Monosiga brevicollis MX1]
MASTVLFEDVFTVRDKDPHGKRFDRVSRVICEGMSFNIELILDLNTQLYPVDLNDRFTLCLASTLSMDDEPDDGYYNQNRNASRADNFDYVMHGTIYRIEDTDNGQQLYVESSASVSICMLPPCLAPCFLALQAQCR